MSKPELICNCRSLQRSTINNDSNWHRIELDDITTNTWKFSINSGQLIIPVTGFYSLHLTVRWVGGSVVDTAWVGARVYKKKPRQVDGWCAEYKGSWVQDVRHDTVTSSSDVTYLPEGCAVWPQGAVRHRQDRSATADLSLFLIAVGDARDIARRNEDFFRR